jgi:hypothetical protein
MESSLSPIVSNIFVEHFEKLAHESALHKSSLLLQYIYDIFVVWPHGPERPQNFLSHLSSLSPSIEFTMESEWEGAIPLLDVLVIRKEMTLATKDYRKPTHTGRCLSFSSNHPPHVKRGLIQSLQNTASTLCQERQDLFNETSSLRRDLQLNDYPPGFHWLNYYSNSSRLLNNEKKALGSMCTPHVKGVSGKFKRIGNPYDIWDDLQN